MIKLPTLGRSFSQKLCLSLLAIFIIASSIWLCMALWFQQPLGHFATSIIQILWIIFACACLGGGYFQAKFFSHRRSFFLYSLMFAFSLIWYFNLDARQDREWAAEVDKVLHVEQHGDLVTLHNVRNFNWHSEDHYDEKWESRTFDLNKISAVNVITSYWMGPQIAHTLVSFDFEDRAPITFSIEIRKEKQESFSALGGFFRKFELSLVAADEKDILFTRSNIRQEQVYFFPIQMPKTEIRALFEEYLHTAQHLEKTPQWYNTLTSNCTTLVFDMAQAISQHQYPNDYRLILSGYLPNYLYDLKALDQRWSIDQWYQHAHINPKTTAHQQISSAAYSQLIRQGLPHQSSPAKVDIAN